MIIPKPGKANYTDKKAYDGIIGTQAYQKQNFGAMPPTWIPICLPTIETALNHVITYTECHRRKGPNFGRVFLMLNYTDITQNTYIQS